MKWFLTIIYFFIIQQIYTIDWESKKQQMIETLKIYGITNTNILNIMKKVPRHEFVPEEYKKYAYEDSPLPIGYGQTISQPYIVAFMTELLELKPTDKVLEIGTGSGYQAAILSHLSREVYTIEIVPELCSKSRSKLIQLSYKNVQVICGDGYKGYKEKAPYDKIILTAAPETIPEALIEQLNNNGILVAPIGKQNEIQYLYKFTKTKNQIKKEKILPVRFVPMVKDQDSKK